MDDAIRFSVLSASGVIFEKNVSYVNLPTDFGSVGILKNHGPMFCAVAAGTARCTFGGGQTALVDVGDGVANVAHNQVTLLVSDGKVKE